MGSLVAELAEKLSSATNNFDIDEGTIYVNTSADTVGIGTTTPGSKLDVQGTMQVGVNDTGHDVKFFGATAGAYLEWDESADELELRGGAATPGKLLLSTAETTVVDGNEIGRINFQAPLDSAGTDAILVGASIHAEADATFSASVNSTDLVFSTGDSATAVERMRIDSSGLVGIGTTAPGNLLNVVGTADNAVVTALQLENTDWASSETGQGVMINFKLSQAGTAQQDAAQIIVGKDSPWHDNAARDAHIAFKTTEDATMTERVRIAHDGKVGIGTTNPQKLLEVSAAVPTFRLNSTEGNVGDTDILGEISWKSADSGRAGDPAAALRAVSSIADGSHTDMVFLTGEDGSAASEKMRIASNGTVGIGTTSHVNSSFVQISNAKTYSGNILLGQLNVLDSTTAAAGVGGGIAFSGKYHSDGSKTTFGSIEGVKENASNDNYSGKLIFKTRLDAGDSTAKMSLFSDGKLSINSTTNHDVMLHVTCSNGSTSDATGGRAICIENADGTNDNYGSLVFRDAQSNDAALIGAKYTNHSTNQGDLVFWTRVGSGSLAQKMVIKSDGKVGIGTTAPGYPLHLKADANNANVVNFENSSSSSPYIMHLHMSAAAPNDTTVYFIRGVDTDGAEFSIRSDGSFYQHSDRRSKENIVDVESMLGKVNALKVKNYNRIGDVSKGFHIGVMAQDVEEIFPHLVDTDEAKDAVLDDDGNIKEPATEERKALYKIGLIFPLIKAVQELSAKNTTLEAKVTALESA